MLLSRPMDVASWTVIAVGAALLAAIGASFRRLADALDSGDGGRRLVELASRLDRTVAEVRRRADRLRRVEVDGGERRHPEVLVSPAHPAGRSPLRG